MAPAAGRRAEAPAPARLADQVARYLAWRTVSGSARATVTEARRALAAFTEWCHEHGLRRGLEVTQTAVERYRPTVADLTWRGRPLSQNAQHKRLVSLRAFFGWLVRQHELPYNPAAALAVPPLVRALPRHVPSVAEVERVLALADVATPLGLRDRAMMEVLYSTGLRRQELTRLSVHDVDPDRGTVLVREGKGRRDRVVPIGRRALGWVRRYLETVRPGLAVESGEPCLFLSVRGRGLSSNQLTERVRGYFGRARVASRGACHLFRHAMATQMLENGADVRYVQAQLGHVELQTTQRYTRVTVPRLTAVHAATHPAEVGMLKRPGA